jgi:hypothetical protein
MKFGKCIPFFFIKILQGKCYEISPRMKEKKLSIFSLNTLPKLTPMEMLVNIRGAS